MKSGGGMWHNTLGLLSSLNTSPPPQKDNTVQQFHFSPTPVHVKKRKYAIGWEGGFFFQVIFAVPSSSAATNPAN
jgi:hypothetical protein